VIILDTNVLSELMRSPPDPLVLAWVAAQIRVELYTTSINKAEIVSGLALLPESKRRAELAASAEAMFAEEFGGKVLPFDEVAADYYAETLAIRRRAGRPIAILDAQIAATALAVGADLATRDAGGFEGCGLRVINPWAGP
jgi:predicted nucleic acid-binding protein